MVTFLFSGVKRVQSMFNDSTQYKNMPNEASPNAGICDEIPQARIIVGR